jgi:hypothetical protein
MNGYAPGTKCVITWQLGGPIHTFLVGQIVTCIAAPPFGFVLRELFPAGITPQNIVHPVHGEGWHPAEWMRPLENPDPIEQPADEEVEA